MGAKTPWHVFAVWILVAAHFICAALSISERIAFDGLPREVIAMVVDNSAWPIAHALIAIALAIGLTVKRVKLWRTLTVSAGVMGGWSLLLLAWDLGIDLAPGVTLPRVSLLGPALGLCLSVLAMAMAGAWNEREED